MRGRKRERREVGRRWPKEAVRRRFWGEGEGVAEEIEGEVGRRKSSGGCREGEKNRTSG